MREQILELGTAGACTLVICNAAYFLGAFVFVWFGVLGAQKGKPRPAPTPPAPEPFRTKTCAGLLSLGIQPGVYSASTSSMAVFLLFRCFRCTCLHAVIFQSVSATVSIKCC